MSWIKEVGVGELVPFLQAIYHTYPSGKWNREPSEASGNEERGCKCMGNSSNCMRGKHPLDHTAESVLTIGGVRTASGKGQKLLFSAAFQEVGQTAWDKTPCQEVRREHE